MKKFLPFILIFIILLVPVFANAAGPIIPCTNNCGFDDLMKLVNNIINWIIMISFPIAAGVFAWAGLKYMTTGVSDQKSAAKTMMEKVFIGFVAILSAWIIVNTITNTLLTDNNGFKEAIPVNGTK